MEQAMRIKRVIPDTHAGHLNYIKFNMLAPHNNSYLERTKIFSVRVKLLAATKTKPSRIRATAYADGKVTGCFLDMDWDDGVRMNMPMPNDSDTYSYNFDWAALLLADHCGWLEKYKLISGWVKKTEAIYLLQPKTV